MHYALNLSTTTLVLNNNMFREEEEFEYEFNCGYGRFKLTVFVVIPPLYSNEELVGRLMSSHRQIPCYLKRDIIDELQLFVCQKCADYYDKHAMNTVRQINGGDCSKLSNDWVSAFQQGHTDYALPEEVTDEEVFADAYHSLIHSPALETLLNLEHTYAAAVEDTVNNKIKEMSHLETRQAADMQQSVEGIGITTTDHDVNNLASRHFEQNQITALRWESQLTSVKEQQKRDYKEWVMAVHEDFQMSPDSTSYLQRARALSHQHSGIEDSEWTPQPVRMEESFTIHLGTQMKTTHNLRLLSADILDLCRHKAHTIGDVIVPQPQRLQTAMSLYSTNLCGMILLVDDRLNSFSGIKREFSKVCEKSTDFHYPDLEDQLEIIRNQAMMAQKWRSESKLTVADNSSQEKHNLCEDKSRQTLNLGDFYVTRHSNLAEVHVVFHMITDDSLLSNDVNSRHPVILGLRNILKTACEKDINTVTIPLLLVLEMSEEMTIQWCLKRAELVFKCIKGFMIETASWGGSETRTVQFLLPPGVSEDLFSSLSSMLPSIFRISNPLVLQT
ncbi:C12orf4 (predicted) [Pycnogonum litorale]